MHDFTPADQGSIKFGRTAAPIERYAVELVHAIYLLVGPVDHPAAVRADLETRDIAANGLEVAELDSLSGPGSEGGQNQPDSHQ